jgi:hypothetical protein
LGNILFERAVNKQINLMWKIGYYPNKIYVWNKEEFNDLCVGGVVERTASDIIRVDIFETEFGVIRIIEDPRLEYGEFVVVEE